MSSKARAIEIRKCSYVAGVWQSKCPCSCIPAHFRRLQLLTGGTHISEHRLFLSSPSFLPLCSEKLIQKSSKRTRQRGKRLFFKDQPPVELICSFIPAPRQSNSNPLFNAVFFPRGIRGPEGKLVCGVEAFIRLQANWCISDVLHIFCTEALLSENTLQS